MDKKDTEGMLAVFRGMKYGSLLGPEEGGRKGVP